MYPAIWKQLNHLYRHQLRYLVRILRLRLDSLLGCVPASKEYIGRKIKEVWRDEASIERNTERKITLAGIDFTSEITDQNCRTRQPWHLYVLMTMYKSQGPKIRFDLFVGSIFCDYSRYFSKQKSCHRSHMEYIFLPDDSPRCDLLLKWRLPPIHRFLQISQLESSFCLSLSQWLDLLIKFLEVGSRLTWDRYCCRRCVC